MNRNNTLLWSILILFVGLVLWMLSTGKLDSVAGLFVNGFWNSIVNMIRPIFHR